MALPPQAATKATLQRMKGALGIRFVKTTSDRR
jgi:hypothetical protein